LAHKPVFVDTDVILDLFLDRPPHHQEALRFFSFIKTNAIPTYTSPVVYANAYYILGKIKDEKYAMDRLRRLRKIVGVATCDEAMVDGAIQTPYKDFEDSLQYQCARANEIPFLVTRNIKHYQKNGIRILLPREFLKSVSTTREE